MKTPILDFVTEYERRDAVRLHMPGHKGRGVLGVEAYDITEIAGADELYHANSIIRESEMHATDLFGTGASFYSTEGSSHVIRSMFMLLLRMRKEADLVVLATRNVHKSFLYTAALLDLQVEWLMPEEPVDSLCSCVIYKETLEEKLQERAKEGKKPYLAVFCTSPDYLGNCQDIAGLSEIAHDYDTVLAVDNAHGAYLHFLPEKMHPMDLGADICCDSAHKTLPVLTGGAYLHLSKNLPEEWKEQAKPSLAMFGTTSPSYLIMASLDACNLYLEEAMEKGNFEDYLGEVMLLKGQLLKAGFHIESSDPYRITIRIENSGENLADYLRKQNMEVEYADRNFVVMMVTPENGSLSEIAKVMTNYQKKDSKSLDYHFPKLPAKRCSIREAMFAKRIEVPVEESIGKICADTTVSCPPAIPIVMPGEEITKDHLLLFQYYEMDKVWIMEESV